MCGIAGILNLDGRPFTDRAGLERMGESIAHRGPDGAGYFADGPIGLAHRRLSIIDVRSGHQPMSNEDDSVWIVFNGEIYNHRELRQILESRGHRYKTNSDTETILFAYMEYGEECVQQLQGMFAFAIWNQRTRQLLLARDRLGIKPLYYAFDGSRLIFGSEIKTLLRVIASAPNLDVESLDCFISLSYVPAPWTLFKGITKLLAGHLMSVTGGQVRTRSYWDLHYRPKVSLPDEELETELKTILTRAVESHLMSEVPLGVFLSGGLDSGFIVSTMTRQLKVPCQTFSIGYEGELSENELTEARSVATRFGTDHHEYRLGAMDFVKEMPAILRHMEEPIASPAIIPLYYLAKAAREHVTVVLSGEGVDELLGGYAIYRRMALAERLHQLGLLRRWFAMLEGVFSKTRYGRFLHDIALPFEKRYIGISSAFDGSEKKREFLLSLPEARLDQTLQRYHSLTVNEDVLDRMLYFDTKVWLVDDLLLKADKMTMASSMELRVPFLDHRVVEYCAQLPVRLKARGDKSKVILRQIMKESFPPEFLNRPKKGFPVPIARWFQGGLRNEISQAILDSGSLSRHLFRVRFLEGLVSKADDAMEANARKIWTLYQIEQWKTEFGVKL